MYLLSPARFSGVSPFVLGRASLKSSPCKTTAQGDKEASSDMRSDGVYTCLGVGDTDRQPRAPGSLAL